MKNSKGETLPQPYYDLALMRREQQNGVENYIAYDTCFSWIRTPEDEEFWHDVNNGETPEIPASSLAELEAWRKAREENKQSEFWGKAAMVADELRDDTTDTTDWKAKYEALEKEANELTAALKELGAKYDELKYGDPDRNWIAECAMAMYASGTVSFLSDMEYVWDRAEAWAAEGKKRGRIS